MAFNYLPLKIISVCVVILGFATLVSVLIHNTEPQAKREAATRRSAMLVEVYAAEAGDFQPVIQAMGTVKSAAEVVLRPQVSGEVIRIGDNFMPGARVKAGELLLQIDPSDYQNQLEQRRSELAQAQSALNIEMGEQAIAEGEYRRLKNPLNPMQEALVLRQPQLASAKAVLASAQAALAQAETELERTRIRAPFDAQIINRQATVGARVSPADDLALLLGTDTYWVEASLPVAKLRWLYTQQTGEMVADKRAVQIRDQIAWPADQYREGRLHSVIGAVDENSRMARVLVEVEDPLAEQPHNRGKMPLLAGSYVACRLPAEPLTNSVRLPKQYLRKNDTAWLMVDGKLSIRELELAFVDENYVYVNAGIARGEQIVTTAISRIREGAELQLKGEKP
ncbi:MAG: efflux RND transporter periplasmic adaptor subunit [Cellvibrionaceae bacterium]|nr:efflux RND transporter periplasmic adaptor subunit [Cellvibrionaceae bacterium]